MIRAKTKRVRSNATPIRASLKSESVLHGSVAAGLQALSGDHRSYIDESLREAFADSIDLDEALRPLHEQENRWDYLLGHAVSKRIVGLEPHSAKEDQVTVVIAKKEYALRQLRDHMKPHARIAAWLWVASGKVYFADTERARRRLDQHGIRFVGTRVLDKHLPLEDR